MHKHMIWDVDGTLFDTYPAITYATTKTLTKMGYSMALNVIDRLVRQSLELCVETLSQRFKLDAGLLRNEFAESYRAISPANQPPFPGAREVCEFIHNNGGVNVIVTHRSVQSTQRLLAVHGLSPYFTDIFSIEQGYPRKPDRAMVLAALEKYALNPDDTLLIGDREIDIQAGQAAGIHTCLFGKAELVTQANFHIGKYSQLLDLLTK